MAASSIEMEENKAEEEIEDYCAESDEDIIGEPYKDTQKRSSIDDQIEQLTNDILHEKDVPLNQSSYVDNTNFQDRVDTLINQMRDISHFTNIKCGMIDKMNILMCILTFKIFDIQHDYYNKLEILKEQRENLVMTTDEAMIPVEFLNLDRIMREVQLCHHEKSGVYKKQKVDMQLEYEKLTTVLDEQLDIMKKNLAILQEEHGKFIGDTNRTEPLLIDYIVQAALEEFTVIVEQFELKQKRGWKSLFGDEQILDTLQSRGLAVSKSGYILTERGEKLSYDEAEKRKLLEGLDFRSKLLPKETRDNEDIIPTPSSIRTDIEESDKDSLASQISSEDVSYLKETLGKPLTLALAEITSKQPRDPIHYLGHWLFKYRYNQELDITQKQEYEALMIERNRLLKEKLHRLYEEEAKLVIFEMINNAENEAIRKELERILREQVMGEDEEDDQAGREYAELKKLLKMIQRPAESR